MPKESKPEANLYETLIEKVFFRHYSEEKTSFEFERTEIEEIASEIGIRPKNLGDVLYSFRYRRALPENIIKTQPDGKNWIIKGIGRSRYEFRLVNISRVIPQPNFITIKIPDATPELIVSYALDDEQALLAKVRYNRLIDIFLGLTTYSLQNHLRTTVADIGQIEIDELYIGLDKNGCHYVIPVQAKGGKDQIGSVQMEQDIRWCKERFPGIACRAISVQFMANDRIAMFELTVEDDEIRIIDEKHYKLVPAIDLDPNAIKQYR